MFTNVYICSKNYNYFKEVSFLIIIMTFLILVLSLYLIINPQIAVNSFMDSYKIISEILLPSLLPFMIISEFITLTKVKNIISYPFKGIFKFLRLPESLCSLFVSSAIGGYPTGAKGLALSYENGIISKNSAENYIPFLINAGPGFVIMAVGKIMFGSLKLGVIFYVSQLISSLIIGRFLLDKELSLKENTNKYYSAGDALILSVNDSSYSMLIISGYVFLFALINSCLCKILGENFITMFMSSMLEVTYGCKIASVLPQSWIITSFLISFSGVSVICQVSSILSKSGISTSGIFTIKFAEGLLSALLTWLMIRLFPITADVLLIKNAPLQSYSQNRIVEAFLIAMMFCQLFHSKDISVN